MMNDKQLELSKAIFKKLKIKFPEIEILPEFAFLPPKTYILPNSET